MVGLKENVIIGKLIPAGTGMKRYRNVKLDSDAMLSGTISFDEDIDENEDISFSEIEDDTDVEEMNVVSDAPAEEE